MIKKFEDFHINEAQEIKPGETYIIKSKTKQGAKKIAEFVNTKGKSIGAEAWVVGTDVNANIPWSPGFKKSFAEDMSNFPDFISFDIIPKKEKKEDPEDIKWRELSKLYYETEGEGEHSAEDVWHWLSMNYKAPTKK